MQKRLRLLSFQVNIIQKKKTRKRNFVVLDLHLRSLICKQVVPKFQQQLPYIVIAAKPTQNQCIGAPFLYIKIPPFWLLKREVLVFPPVEYIKQGNSITKQIIVVSTQREKKGKNYDNQNF